MRLFGARESSFPSAELGRTCRVPEDAASIAAKNLGVAPARMSSQIPQRGPQAKASRARPSPDRRAIPDGELRNSCGGLPLMVLYSIDRPPRPPQAIARSMIQPAGSLTGPFLVTAA